MKESDIKHEAGRFWVCDDRSAYTVCKPYGTVASIGESSYAHTPNGLSPAIARCNYLANRKP